MISAASNARIASNKSNARFCLGRDVAELLMAVGGHSFLACFFSPASSLLLLGSIAVSSDCPSV